MWPLCYVKNFVSKTGFGNLSGFLRQLRSVSESRSVVLFGRRMAAAGE